MRLFAVALAAIAAAVSWTWIPLRVWHENHDAGAATALVMLGIIPAAAAGLAWRKHAPLVAAAALFYCIITFPLGSAIGGPVAIPARLIFLAMFASILGEAFADRHNH